MSERTKTWLKRGIAAVLLVLLVYFFWPLLGELRAAAALFGQAHWIWFGMAILLQIVSYAALTWLNSLALQPFQGRISFGRLAAVLTSMAFIQVAVPSLGASGIAMRVHLLKKSGYRSEDSLASLVVETLGEVVAITTVVLIGASYLLSKQASMLSVLSRYFLVVFLFLGVIGYAWRVLSDPERTRRHLFLFVSVWDRLGRRWGKVDVEKVEQRISEFRCNMQNYKNVPLWEIVLASYAKVILDVATLGAAFYMFGYPISLGQLLIGYGLILLFSGTASLPGGLGMTEASTPVIFYWLGVPGSVALAAGLIYRLIAFWLVRFVGFICWQVLEFEKPAPT
jgi:uncharacterized protein (TIRG00374 family)